MEAFSHFITTDDCTAHSCRRRGRRGCLSCTPTLFFFFLPSLCFPQKETKKGSISVLRMYVKYHVENDFIPRFPSLLWTSPKQQILQTLRQSAGFLIHARFAPSRKKLRVPERQRPGCSFRQGMVLCAERGIGSRVSRACFPASFQVQCPGFELHPGKIN